VKDSDDENEEEKVSRYILEERKILDEQRARVEKKAAECTPMDIEAIERHLERLYPKYLVK
jgi:DNA-binding SARP family transcriptional activator